MSLLLAFLLILPFNAHFISASDPDPVQDFCIPTTPSSFTTCKNASDATVEDFIYTGIKASAPVSVNGFSSKPVNSNVFPGLNTLGGSLVRADFGVGGVNVPHYHPRATEVAYVLEGRIYSGFVDTQGKSKSWVDENSFYLFLDLTLMNCSWRRLLG
ncbi:hypothetical protein Cgig2_022550 [Carnegiea gigantea]|uniref:Cupin type-1 domain-containing protein n=1 Tax=Carnegiea gigantea TaxID=171969 RepID=A0A9Q1KLC3_9CARY|nr:hypothetical protein Cgig2_022550 [Carnegiea gigantea]